MEMQVKVMKYITLYHFYNLDRTVQWYNMEKLHRSLPDNSTPSKKFHESKEPGFRSLKAKVEWNRWLNKTARFRTKES